MLLKSDCGHSSVVQHLPHMHKASLLSCTAVPRQNEATDKTQNETKLCKPSALLPFSF